MIIYSTQTYKLHVRIRKMGVRVRVKAGTGMLETRTASNREEKGKPGSCGQLYRAGPSLPMTYTFFLGLGPVTDNPSVHSPLPVAAHTQFFSLFINLCFLFAFSLHPSLTFFFLIILRLPLSLSLSPTLKGGKKKSEKWKKDTNFYQVCRLFLHS